MARTKESLISRHDHHHFHGWVCVIKRGEDLWRKYFSDKPHGSAATLRRARAWRDKLLKKLPPPVKVHRRSSVTTTGVIGVFLSRDISKSGKLLERYAAHLPLAEGGYRKRSFAVLKYGRLEAFRLAIEARDQGVATLIADRKRGVKIRTRRRSPIPTSTK